MKHAFTPTVSTHAASAPSSTLDECVFTPSGECAIKCSYQKHFDNDLESQASSNGGTSATSSTSKPLKNKENKKEFWDIWDNVALRLI